MTGCSLKHIGFWQALIDTNDHEIYVSLTCCYNERYQREKGAVGTQLIRERAQIILDEVRKLSLFTRADCLKHIGTDWCQLANLYRYLRFMAGVYSYFVIFFQVSTSNLPLVDFKEKHIQS